jgi:hypothetical protein
VIELEEEDWEMVWGRGWVEWLNEFRMGDEGEVALRGVGGGKQRNEEIEERHHQHFHPAIHHHHHPNPRPIMQNKRTPKSQDSLGQPPLGLGQWTRRAHLVPNSKEKKCGAGGMVPSVQMNSPGERVWMGFVGDEELQGSRPWCFPLVMLV